MTEKILCVDDEPDILAGYQRLLRKRFTLEVAVGALEGLAAIAERGPYAVVVSDMLMPGMDGVRFLSRVREVAPATVRILLTGNAAPSGVGEGDLFQVLAKPCPPETLARVLAAAVERYCRRTS